MSCRAPRSPMLKATDGPALEEVRVDGKRRKEDSLSPKRWSPEQMLPPHLEHPPSTPPLPKVRAAGGARCTGRRYATLACAALLAPLVGSYAWLCWSLARRERLHRWRYRGGGEGGGVGASAQGEIPRIIHQMYRSAELPERWQHVPQAWKALHADYQYMLWTDTALRELIADEYPWLLATYDAYPHDTQRWDASRFAILHKYGGVYADLDVEAVERIDPLLAGQRLLLPHTPNIGLTNALMASVAAHPFMDEALRSLPSYAHAWYHLSKHNTVLSSTGSTYVWALFMRWPDAEADPPALMQARTWGKCSVCRPPTTQLDPDLPEGRPLFKHSRGNSWHDVDSTLVLLVFCHLQLATGLALGALAFYCLRSRALAGALAGGSLAVGWLVSALGINLFEVLLARPWIWLIMG